MIRADVARVGSVGAYAVGVLYFLCAILLALGVVHVNHSQVMDDEMAQYLAGRPFTAYVYEAADVLALVFFIPVVTALSELFERANAGLVRWAAIMGYIGCTGGIMSRLMSFTYVPARARIYLQGDELAQVAVKYTWYESVDPQLWVQFGALGFWLFVVAFTTLRKGRLDEPAFSGGWAYLSLVAAILHLAMPVSRTGFPWLEAVAGALGGLVVAPLWGIWTGRKLSSLARTERAGPAGPEYQTARATGR